MELNASRHVLGPPPDLIFRANAPEVPPALPTAKHHWATNHRIFRRRSKHKLRVCWDVRIENLRTPARPTDITEIASSYD
jgi:hypothetical protein